MAHSRGGETQRAPRREQIKQNTRLISCPVACCPRLQGEDDATLIRGRLRDGVCSLCLSSPWSPAFRQWFYGGAGGRTSLHEGYPGPCSLVLPAESVLVSMGASGCCCLRSDVPISVPVLKKKDLMKTVCCKWSSVSYGAWSLTWSCNFRQLFATNKMKYCWFGVTRKYKCLTCISYGNRVRLDWSFRLTHNRFLYLFGSFKVCSFPSAAFRLLLLQRGTGLVIERKYHFHHLRGAGLSGWLSVPAVLVGTEFHFLARPLLRAGFPFLLNLVCGKARGV